MSFLSPGAGFRLLCPTLSKGEETIALLSEDPGTEPRELRTLPGCGEG